MKRSLVEQSIDSKTPLPFTLTQSGDLGGFTFFSWGPTSPFSEHQAHVDSFLLNFTPLVQKSALDFFCKRYFENLDLNQYAPFMAFSSACLYCMLTSNWSRLEMQFLNLVFSLKEMSSSFRIMQLFNASSKFSFDFKVQTIFKKI
jgi:hypothetical protein